MNIRVIRPNGETVILKPDIKKYDEKTVVSVSKEIVGKAEYVDFLYDYCTAEAGEYGYFVLPFECVKGISLTYFIQRKDTEYVSDFSQIYCYGMKKGNESVFGIITGCKYDYALVAGVKNGKYYTYPRFKTEGLMPEEDIIVEYYTFVGGYSEMARCSFRRS